MTSSADRPNTLAWIKSSHSGNTNACVEVALAPDGDILVRNSNRPGAGTIGFTPQEWKAFLTGAKDGEFDHLAS
jgi:hypothetical protein